MSWQKNLAEGFSSVAELLEFLALPSSIGSKDAEKKFKTRVPRGFAARMQKGNRFDPLLLQILAVDEELHAIEGYSADPLKEVEGQTTPPGLLHKYQGRVLLTLTGVCAVNCRYCFRRHFPYQANNPGRQGWQEAFAYIQQDASITEVILSGGDPLLASDRLLKEFIQALEAIPHVTILRFHTRIPVVLPERITPALLDILAATRLQKVVVLHCNHAQELDKKVEESCYHLKQINCHLLNQSVLLKGINDKVEVLAALSLRLFACGVLPYYLHLFDKVAGAAHFDLADEKAFALYSQLQKKLPGYLLPRLAREEAGKASKTLYVALN